MNFIRRIILAIKFAFNESMEFIKDNFDIPVLITEKAKEYLHSDAVEFLVGAVAGAKGMITLELAQKISAQAAEKFAVTAGIFDAVEKNSDVVKAVLDYIKVERPDLEESFYILFTGQLNVALSEESAGGKKLTLGEGITLGQLAWQEFKRKRSKK